MASDFFYRLATHPICFAAVSPDKIFRLTCRAVQGQEPDLIKIVMADHVTKELIEARERGIIQAYLDKPVSVVEILNTSIRIRSEAEKGKGRI